MLRNYVKLVADKLKSGGKVYLCPACMETLIIAKMLKKEYSVAPSGFCDNDVRKHGKYLNSMPELKIFSFDDVLLDEQAEFLIVSPHHSSAMMGDLVFERGVSEKRILNFQPVERRKICPFFVQNWIVHEERFVCCCMGNASPGLDNQQRNPEKGVEYLNKIRKEMLAGERLLPGVCQSCYNYKDCYIYMSGKLNSFNLSFRGWCNYKCEYCSANQPDKKNYNDGFSLEQYLIELEKRDMVNDIFSVLFAVGEPCLNEKRFSFYDYCGEKQYFLDVFSNCSVFDKSLFDLADRSPVIIRKSFDAGTPETYTKIKGVNCFEKMLENVGNYLKAPYLVLNPKYLLVPGINDNEVDVKNFVEICTKFRVDFVTPVFSILDNKYSDSDHAKRIFKLLVDELAANNIFTANVDTLYSEQYHKTYLESF